jgi:hypothetical protein
MTPEQRTRLVALLPAMKTMARRKVSQNEYHRRFNECGELAQFLADDIPGCNELAQVWIGVAEKAAEGHDKPGIVRMPSMAAVLSGMPPEHKGGA